jgi:hypothetical protein
MKPLTEIAKIAKRNYQGAAKGSQESNDWFRVWKLATEGDARTLSDDPTVKAKKRAAKKTSTGSK